MELTIRDWMVIIGAGLILAVLADAARRVYRDRRSEVRLNAKIHRSDAPEDADDAFDLLSELPNGGARIVRRSDLAPETSGEWSQSDGEEAGLDDSAEPTQPGGAETDGFQPLASEPPSIATPVPSVVPESADDGLAAGVSSVDTPVGNIDWLEELDTTPEPKEEARLPRGVDPHVFVLNVVSRSEAGFAGNDILQILLACDLRFGDMDFFHRHEHAAGRGAIQFSVANMMKPGVFDIDNMASLRTQGLMFFVTLPGPEDMLKAFDFMYETAKTIARNLDGDVLDETRSVITPQSLEHMRQQIRELERRILVHSER